MSPITVVATVRPDGSLTVEKVPFPPGQRVEVIVRPAADDPTEGGKYPLRGREPYKYDDPFGPAIDADDIEAMK
jgi:hypothetical protein